MPLHRKILSSKEAVMKPFGYCSTNDHHLCPVRIEVMRTEGKTEYRKRFECGCSCHDNNQQEETCTSSQNMD